MDSQQMKALEAEYLLPTYARFDLCLVRGKGCRAWDAEGKAYLDFGSGIGVNSLGWADDGWAQAVARQAATLQHTSNLYTTPPGTLLAQALCQRTGYAKVFFANSGAEANEGAIKAARKYSRDKYGEGRHTVVALQNSFHGRTMATLSATGQAVFHQHFQPFLPGFVHLPANDVPALGAALDGSVCALLLEPIQGEGGVLPLKADYLQAVQRLCEKHDVLLLADEVQCGVGRTGAFLASQKYGLQPDVVTLAKGLGGGLPIGAVLFNTKAAGVLGQGHHATTFGANPVCCAAALQVMQRLDDAFLAKVEQNGHRLRRGLEALAGVQAVSGDGLMLGASLAEGIPAAGVVQKAMEKGLLCLTAKDKLRLLPPLVITSEEIDEGLGILKQVLEELA